MDIIAHAHPTAGQRILHHLANRDGHPSSTRARHMARQRRHTRPKQRLIRNVIPHPRDQLLLQQQRLDRLRRRRRKAKHTQATELRIPRLRTQPVQQPHPRDSRTWNLGHLAKPTRITQHHRQRLRHPTRPKHPLRPTRRQLQSARHTQMQRNTDPTIGVDQNELPAPTHRLDRTTRQRVRTGEPGGTTENLSHQRTHPRGCQLTAHHLHLRQFRHPNPDRAGALEQTPCVPSNGPPTRPPTQTRQPRQIAPRPKPTTTTPEHTGPHRHNTAERATPRSRTHRRPPRTPPSRTTPGPNEAPTPNAPESSPQRGTPKLLKGPSTSPTTDQ